MLGSADNTLVQSKVNIKISNFAAAKDITKQSNIYNIKQNHVSDIERENRISEIYKQLK